MVTEVGKMDKEMKNKVKEFKMKNIEMSKGYWKYVWKHQKWLFLLIIILPVFVGIIIAQYLGNKFYMRFGLKKQIESEKI